jgi:ABC-type transport system involved in multi-copper enzyme maturation permease subunit
VWTNLIWTGGFLKVLLGIMVVISVTNEFSYRTLRQNIIDGLSRWEFIYSKILTNLLLSLMSVAMLFVVGLITGMIYSPFLDFDAMTTDLEFFPAYFLEIFFFLSYALLISILVQRSGLTIILLILSQGIELIIKAWVDDVFPEVIAYFPMQSIWDLIQWPFPRYAFQEIHDYISLSTVAIVLFWTATFNYLSYLKLKSSDI